MAKTYNPLHKFRSYSYHFAILISDNMTTLASIDAQEHSDNLERFMHPTSEDDNSTKYDLKTLGDTKYCVLYNSLQSAEYSIDTLEMTFNLYNNGTSLSGIQNTLNFRITEPLTVDFLVAMLQCQKNVHPPKSDTNGDGNIDVELDLGLIKFGLKVFFIGYTDEQQLSKPTIISNVAIYEFRINSIEFSVSERGAVYDIKAVPIINGVGFDSYVSTIGGLSTKLSVGLYDALKDFEKAINDRVEASQGYDKNDLKFPKYIIYVDEVYKDPKYQLDLVANTQMDTYAHAPKTVNDTNDKANETVSQQSDAEQKAKDAKKAEAEVLKPIIMNFKIGDDITAAIKKIMMLSSKVNEDAYKPETEASNKTSKAYMPSVLSDGSTENLKIYHVIRQSVYPHEDSESTYDPESSEYEEKLPDILEWDYIYTGKNIDIKKFDMKLQGYLSPSTKLMIGHSNNINDNKDLNGANKTIQNPQNSNHDDLKTGGDKDNQASVYKGDNSEAVGPLVRDSGRHGSGSLNPSLVFGMRKALSANALMTGSEFTLELVGNPMLLAGYIIPGNIYSSNGEPFDEAKIKENLDKHKAKTGHDLSIIKFAKVNIRVPKPSYLQGKVYEEGNDNFYSTKFWWDQNYQIMNIVAKFNRGNFTQYLKLKPIVNDGAIDTTSKNSNPASDKPSDNAPATSEPSVGNYDNITAFKCMLAEFEAGKQFGPPGKGYNIIYGSNDDSPRNLSDHPFRGKNAKHTPAGRYQILLGTFDNVKGKVGASDFSPESQEKICDYLLKYRKVYDLISQGKINTALALNTGKNKWTNLENEWESLRPHKHSKQTIIDTYKKYGGKVTDDPNGKNDTMDKSSNAGDASTFLQVAEGEVGYVEKPTNDTKYGAELGVNFQFWCGAFVQWCAKHSGTDIPWVVKTSDGAAAFKKLGRWHDDNPQPGDLVFYKMSNNPTINHIGIVVSDNGDTITTIEGNTSSGSKGSQRNGGMVAKKSRPKKPNQHVAIVGYGRPNFKNSKPSNDSSKTDASSKETLNDKSNYKDVLKNSGIDPNSDKGIMMNAMATEEGWNSKSKNYKTNNPGNQAYDKYATEVDPKSKELSKGSRFAVFETPEQGTKALSNKIDAWAKNGTPSQRGKEPTFLEFFKSWAPAGDGGNDPNRYAQHIVDALNKKGHNLTINDKVSKVI